MQTFEQYVKRTIHKSRCNPSLRGNTTSGDTTTVIDVGMNTTDYGSATAVSNYQYEQKLQEQKQRYD